MYKKDEKRYHLGTKDYLVSLEEGVSFNGTHLLLRGDTDVRPFGPSSLPRLKQDLLSMVVNRIKESCKTSSFTPQNGKDPVSELECRQDRPSRMSIEVLVQSRV